MGRFSQRSARCVVAGLAWSLASASMAAEQPCPGNPDALGVSRVMTVSPSDYSKLGKMQYRTSLPLKPREVVLTFDDGPLPPYTDRILDILANNCVKATFFMVGRHVAANPEAARRVLAAGHTVGNHSQNHSLHFNALAEARAEQEVEVGARSITAALGEGQLAPFFRVPGLNRTNAIEKFAHDQSLIVWSSDTLADDWTRINANQVVKRALSRLEARDGGVLLLHDIQPRTVLALPTLLAELKRRNFTIVHVVPERNGEQAPVQPPVQVEIAQATPDKLNWPRILANNKRSWPRVATADGSVPPMPHEEPAAQAPVPTPEPVAVSPSADNGDQLPPPPHRKHKVVKVRHVHRVAAAKPVESAVSNTVAY